MLKGEIYVDRTNTFYKEMFDNGPYAYLYCQVKSDFSNKANQYIVDEANAYFCSLADLYVEDIIGKNIQNIMAKFGGKTDEFCYFLDQVFCSKEHNTMNYYSAYDNQWYKISAYCTQNEYMVISIIEASEKKSKAEKYYDLLMTINDIVIEFDEDYEITDVCLSDTMIDFAPMHQKMINRNVFDILSEENAKRYIKAFQESRKSHKLIEFDYEERRHPHDFTWNRAEVMCKEKNNGKPTYYAAIYNIQKEKNAEKALLQKTDELERFFEIVPGILCISDMNGNITKVNKAWETLLGYSVNDYKNKKYQDFIHPDDVQYTFEAFKDIKERKIVMDLVNRYQGKDGRYRYISWNCYSDGTSIYAVAVDITKTKKYEDELFRQKQFLKILIDTIPDCIFYKDKNGKFLGCNDSMCKAILREEKEIIGKTEKELNSPNEEIHLLQEKEVLKTQKTKIFEESIKDAYGVHHYLETIKKPLKNERNEITGIIGISRDITNHKLAEEKIRESEERFRQMAENIDEVFWLSNQSEMLYISPGYEKIWKRSVAPIYEDMTIFRKHIYKDDSERVNEALKRDAYIKEGYFNEKYRILKPDGTLRWIWEKSFPIRDDKGNIVRRAGIAQDITTIKIAEEVVAKTKEEMMQVELQKKSMELEQLSELDRLRTDFFANLSHELRTPINLIFSALKMIELLQEGDSKGDVPSFDKYLRIIKQNSYRLMRLINNLIDVTRLDAGFMRLNVYNWDIIDIVKSVTLSVSEYAKSKKIDLKFHSDIEHLKLRCDADNIERIMLNLLSNAIKFNKENGKIWVSVSHRNDNLLISVRDTGIGIPQEKLEMIFERFKQVDRRFTKEGEGSGIGLSLVKAFAEMHGGSVSLKSMLGSGSEFIVRLPIIKDNAEDRKQKLGFDEREDSREERIRMEFSDIYGLKF